MTTGADLLVTGADDFYELWLTIKFTNFKYVLLEKTEAREVRGGEGLRFEFFAAVEVSRFEEKNSL